MTHEQLFKKFYELEDRYMEGMKFLKEKNLWEEYLNFRLHNDLDRWIPDDE